MAPTNRRDLGLCLCVCVALVALAQQSTKPVIQVLARKRGTNVFRERSKEHAGDETYPGLLMLRLEGRVFFLNADDIAEKIAALIAEANPRVVAIDMQGVVDLLQANPDSFEAYARAYSEIGSARNGGDPGGTPYLDEMRPAFRAGLQNVPEGKVSPILREERSLHIFQVDKWIPDPATGRKRIKYHEIAMRVNPGTEALRVARAQVAEVRKQAEREGLAGVAARRGLRTFASDYFAKGQAHNSVFDQFPEVEIWVFSGKIGSISNPVPTQLGWYLYQILDRRKPGLRPLEEVKDQARLALIRSLETAKAEAAAAQARAAVLGGMKEEAAAKQFRGIAGVSPGVTRNGFVSGMGQEPRAVGTLFTLFVVPVFYLLIAEKHRRDAEEETSEDDGALVAPNSTHAPKAPMVTA
jgi:parvulin-like peptidyl-prolyl isomerase